MVGAMRSKTKEYLKLLDTIEERKKTKSSSFFEIRPAFTVFGVPFIQLLLTTQDIHAMMSSLKQVGELPCSVQQFDESQYFANIEFRPLWIRVYFRTPAPVETSYNWRNVVFTLNEVKVPKTQRLRAKCGSTLRKKSTATTMEMPLL
jgi:hypothetical protein